MCRAAVHLSLLALYGLGGWLVSNQLMPIRTLLSAIGFTFSLVFATQGVVQTFTDARRAIVSLHRWGCTTPPSLQECACTKIWNRFSSISTKTLACTCGIVIESNCVMRSKHGCSQWPAMLCAVSLKTKHSLNASRLRLLRLPLQEPSMSLTITCRARKMGLVMMHSNEGPHG